MVYLCCHIVLNEPDLATLHITKAVMRLLSIFNTIYNIHPDAN